MDTTLGTLSVQSAAAGSGQTTITVNAQGNADTMLVYKTDETTPPAVAFGTALTAAAGWVPLPANGQIAATNGHKITVALVGTQSGLPLGSGNATVVAGS